MEAPGCIIDTPFSTSSRLNTLSNKSSQTMTWQTNSNFVLQTIGSDAHSMFTILYLQSDSTVPVKQLAK